MNNPVELAKKIKAKDEAQKREALAEKKKAEAAEDKMLKDFLSPVIKWVSQLNSEGFVVKNLPYGFSINKKDKEICRGYCCIEQDYKYDREGFLSQFVDAEYPQLTAQFENGEKAILCYYKWITLDSFKEKFSRILLNYL